jgi:hypothetical protein
MTDPAGVAAGVGDAEGGGAVVWLTAGAVFSATVCLGGCWM